MIDSALRLAMLNRILVGTRSWAVVLDAFTALWFIVQSVDRVCGPAPRSVVVLLTLSPFMWPLLAWFLVRVYRAEECAHPWVFWPSLPFVVSPALKYLAHEFLW
jgi:hypothetical protein